MSIVDRRQFVGASAVGLVGLLPGRRATQDAAASVEASEPAEHVTRTLAEYVVRARPQDLPAPVRAEACRTLLNWGGCTVDGSRHETVGIVVRALQPFAGPPRASLLGRRERMSA